MSSTISTKRGIRVSRIPEGVYAKKQISCRDPLIAWSHRARFEVGRTLVSRFAGRRLLDYGCGDGTFLQLVEDLFPDAVGVEIAEDLIRSGNERFQQTAIRFSSPAALRDQYDVVTCMEVMEHCTDLQVDQIIDDILRLLAPEGRALVSVPIEVGLSLLVKEAGRAIAGWRKLGDYAHKETYRLSELARMVLASENSRITRPLYPDGVTDPQKAFHGHKGFNWKGLRRRLARDFVVEDVRFSPLPWLGSFLASQAWFVCRPRR